MTSREQVQEVFRDVFQDSDLIIRDEMNATSIPNWDSLNHINLIVALEGTFGIQFKSEEIVALANVGDLVTLLGKYGIR